MIGRPRFHLLLATLVSMLAWLVAPAALGADVDVSVVEDTPAHTIVQLRVHHFDAAPVTIGSEVYTQLSLQGEARLEIAGAPEVPSVTRSIIIGADAEVQLQVLSSSYSEIADVAVEPSKGRLYRDVLPSAVPHTFGPEYGQDAFYPSALATLSQPYILRDFRGIAVTFHPLQHNPVTRSLRVYDTIVVKIAKVGTSSTNVLSGGPSGLSRSFQQLSARHFLNYGTRAPYAPLNEEGSMLIIAHDAWLANVQPLVAHKSSIGIETTAVGISTVGNSANAIKSYIQNAYNNGNLAFVLLVGDSNHVATPYASGGAADPTYAKVAGGDSYPDILVGRFSAQSAAEVDTQVQRTIDYEVEEATQQPWFRKGVGIASFEGPGDDGEYDNEHVDKIRDDLLANGFTHVDQFYGGGASSSQLINALNDGRGIINYTGHGDPYSFATTGFNVNSVNALTNTGMLPFVFSVACNTGQFESTTSLGEKLLRATHNGAPAGAVGMYASSILQSWSPPMAAQDEFVDLFVAESYFSLGALAFAGSAKMIDEYGSGGVEMFNTWILFGDPSLRTSGTIAPATGMRVSPESDFEAAGEVGGPFDVTTMDFVVENLSESAVDFSALADQPWLSVSPTGGSLSPGQSAVVTVTLNDEAHTLGSGHWIGSVQFINETNHDGDTQRAVSVTVGSPEQVYDWPLDTDPGWTTEGDWTFGQPTGDGGGELGYPDPTAGATGQNVYGYNLAGNYPNNLGEMSLTTEPIDCTGLSKVSLRFSRWLNLEESIYDHAYVRVSSDGEHWTTVWENGGTITDSAWQPVELDISEWADGQPSVQIRWTMGSTDGGLVASGWNIDDVQLWAVQQSCGDADGDGELPIECGGLDCHDYDASVYSGATEICRDGIDNNCDGAIDLADADCGGGSGNNDDDDGRRLRSLGCGCHVAGSGERDGAGLAALALLAAALLRRRRRE